MPPPRGFYTSTAWQKQQCAVCVRICVCVYSGRAACARVAIPLDCQEAHGKFTPWAKPQAFSIISVDFSFLNPFKNVIITERVFFFFFFSGSSRAFWAFLAVAALCF